MRKRKKGGGNLASGPSFFPSHLLSLRRWRKYSGSRPPLPPPPSHFRLTARWRALSSPSPFSSSRRSQPANQERRAIDSFPPPLSETHFLRRTAVELIGALRQSVLLFLPLFPFSSPAVYEQMQNGAGLSARPESSVLPSFFSLKQCPISGKAGDDAPILITRAEPSLLCSLFFFLQSFIRTELAVPPHQAVGVPPLFPLPQARVNGRKGKDSTAPRAPPSSSSPPSPPFFFFFSPLSPPRFTNTSGIARGLAFPGHPNSSPLFLFSLSPLLFFFLAQRTGTEGGADHPSAFFFSFFFFPPSIRAVFEQTAEIILTESAAISEFLNPRWPFHVPFFFLPFFSPSFLEAEEDLSE